MACVDWSLQSCRVGLYMSGFINLISCHVMLQDFCWSTLTYSLTHSHSHSLHQSLVQFTHSFNLQFVFSSIEFNNYQPPALVLELPFVVHLSHSILHLLIPSISCSFIHSCLIVHHVCNSFMHSFIQSFIH